MFEHWDSFYLLLGGAAGALIGLLFIVVTITQGRDPDSALRASAIYMSPIVLHLAVVLTISALATAPSIGARPTTWVIAACAALGAVQAGRVIWHLGIRKTFTASHWSDVWWYGVWAFVADIALGASAAVTRGVSEQAGADLAGASLVAILLIAIRNAWDLVTWISATAKSDAAKPPAQSGS